MYNVSIIIFNIMLLKINKVADVFKHFFSGRNVGNVSFSYCILYSLNKIRKLKKNHIAW